MRLIIGALVLVVLGIIAGVISYVVIKKKVKSSKYMYHGAVLLLDKNIWRHNITISIFSINIYLFTFTALLLLVLRLTSLLK